MQSNFCTFSIKCSVFKNNYIDTAIMEHSGGSIRCFVGYFFGPLSLLGHPGRPKVISIKLFTISRGHFGLPDRIFSSQGTEVVPVLSFFFDRPRSSGSLGYNLKRPGRSRRPGRLYGNQASVSCVLLEVFSSTLIIKQKLSSECKEQ